MKLQKWTRPANYSGADWTGWYVFLSRNRDSSLLQNSNFQNALNRVKRFAVDVESEEMSGVQVVSENHWACGWVEWIAIHESNTAALQDADSIWQHLGDYPVLDETALSEAELEAYGEAWEAYGARDFTAALIKGGFITEDCEFEPEPLLEVFQDLIPSGEYYTPEGSGVSLRIDRAIWTLERQGGFTDDQCAKLGLETAEDSAQ